MRPPDDPRIRGYRNGNQELVYQAIAKGARMVGDIENATGLDTDTVRNHLRRLCDANRVRRYDTRPQVYDVVRTRCELAEAWK